MIVESGWQEANEGETPRFYGVIIGQQGSGKTYQMRGLIRELAVDRDVLSVWICDLTGEHHPFDYLSDGLTCLELDHPRDLYTITSDEMPDVVIWRLPTGVDDPLSWDIVFREAIAQGRILLVLDEGYHHAPSSGSVWGGTRSLRRIILQGRHIANCRGELEPCHVLIAAQYPYSIHHLVWDQAAMILCGRIRGERSEAWIRQNFGESALREVNDLSKHEFCQLHPREGEANDERSTGN